VEQIDMQGVMIFHCAILSNPKIDVFYAAKNLIISGYNF